MNLLNLFRSRNILFIFALGITYSALTPYVQYLLRDKSKDHFNIWHDKQLLEMHLQIKTGNNCKDGLLQEELYNNTNVPYSKQKPFLKTNFSVRIPKSVSLNHSNLFACLYVSPKECTFGDILCKTLLAQNTLIHFGKFNNPIPHSLINTTQKSISTNTSSYEPYIYDRTRFDIVHSTSPYNHDDMILRNSGVQFFRLSSPPRGMKNKLHYPVVQSDYFFDIRNQRRRLNTTEGHKFQFRVEISIRGTIGWYLKHYITFSTELTSEIMGPLFDFYSHEIDKMKNMFIESNPLLLWSTGIVTIFHFIFSTLAFENDLRFWHRMKTFHGVSVRTIILQFIGSLITFLYVIDQDLDIFTRIIEFFRVSLHIWKLFKLLRIDLRFPFIHRRKEYSQELNQTDATGMKYMSWIAIPLILIYAVYQFINGKFTSIRAYILHVLTGTVYSFDFLSMLPQLYVNYKLKTVAGMSRSAFIYKFLNTFIDDMYTFLAKLPLIYKIFCFRDDVVFFIWLVQCFIYPTDYTRENEYGYKKLNEEEEDKIEKDGDNNKLSDENVSGSSVNVVQNLVDEDDDDGHLKKE